MSAPLCSDPYRTHAEQKETVVANEVDHIISRRKRPDLVFDLDNLQPLCKACHSTKTRKEIIDGEEEET